MNNNNRPTIVFEAVRLKNSEKKGIITPDKDGCYTQCIGALNAFNSCGDFYEYEAALKFFLDDSSFQRKIRGGVLRAEYGHPKLQGLTKEQFANRIIQIYENMECGTWRRIWLSNVPIQDDKGNRVIPIMGSIKPNGPYGEPLRAKFEDPGEEVCFSIRSFTRDSMGSRGYVIKRLVQIITFDYVNEPGIYVARKTLSPTLESLTEQRYNLEELITNYKNSDSSYFSTEANECKNEIICSLEEIIEHETKRINGCSKPAFTRWL